MVQHGRLLGVLDLDSPSLARFDDEDRIDSSAIVAVLLDRPHLLFLRRTSIRGQDKNRKSLCTFSSHRPAGKHAEN